MRKGIKYVLLIIVPVVSIGLFSFTPTGDKYFQIAKNLEIFTSIYQELNENYVDEINPNQLLNTGVKAMLKKLDPYTVYIQEDDIEDYRTMATGEYGGIGIQSNKVNGKHVVLMIYENSPADQAGIKISDEIISMDGVDVRDKSDLEFGKLIKGQAGTEVQLTISRNLGRETLDLTMKREKIVIPNISYKGMITEDIGYLRLSEFTRDAGEDVRKTVKELKEQGAEKIVLDLRENPGGLLNEAVNICNVFIPKGQKVVHTKGKTKKQSYLYNTRLEPLDLKIPLAVLINSKSASASEIVSGVMQDYDRGVLIGQKSYGKGLVQMTKPLSYNAQLKLTTAKYYVPSGRCIQALDYSHRRSDGSVGSIPDSLKSTFKTTNGRIVFDGGGVDPDIETEVVSLSSYSANLAESGLLFEYATKYYFSHEKIADAKSFHLTNEEYSEFMDWMKTKDFENNSLAEETISELRKASESDKVYKNLLDEIDQLQAKVTSLKSNGLTTYREEITRLLEEGIISRYYLKRGVVEASLEQDVDVNKAIEVLNNSNEYNEVLASVK
ncbi:S41 family peptidase [Reichenbachiella sp. MALMAid0571]|uniref:S41 family peptidase n=1 Tax=Reichenbachiella sp. MALMAid0571 TaxID=3143939 RepID=UPI0032DFC9AD